jgi:hypothetical protein
MRISGSSGYWIHENIAFTCRSGNEDHGLALRIFWK